MQLYKAERPARYLGPILECPTKKLVNDYSYQLGYKLEGPTDTAAILKNTYDRWSEKFFATNPRRKLTHNGFAGDSLTVCGSNGRWIVAWWFESDTDDK